MRQLPTGTVTLLFTDIEGSTRLLQELGRERYVRALGDHRRLLRETFAAHGGAEVEMQGDSFHFAFPSAREAVAAATAAQRALAGHGWEASPVKVRMGLHTGEPVEADGLYAGLDVHRAARVMGAADGGQILLSERTADLVEGELPEGVALRDVGEHRLKDLSLPQRLYFLVIDGAATPLPSTSERALERGSTRAGRALQHLAERSGRVLLAGVVLLLFAAAFGVAQLVGAFSRGGGGESPTTSRTANEAGTVVGQPIELFADVAHIAVSDDAVWVANQQADTPNQGRAARIDPSLNEVVGLPIELPEPAGGLAIALGDVWIASGRSLTRIDGTTGEVDAVIRVGARRTYWTDVAASRDAIWVSRFEPPPGRGRPRSTVLRIDPKNNRPVGKPIPVGRHPGLLAAGEGAVWVLALDGTVTRIDPVTNSVVGEPIRVATGDAGNNIVAGEGAVWIASAQRDGVVSIDPESHQVVGGPITGPWKDPIGLAVSDGALWVSDALRGTVSRVDIDSRAVVGTPIRVGSGPVDVAIGHGAVWVANTADGTVTRIEPTP